MFRKIIKIGLSTAICLNVAACTTTTKDSNNQPISEEKKIATAKVNAQLGIAYLEQHNIQRAKRKLLMALQEAPNIPDTWYSMGYFLEVTGNKEEANRYYLKAVDLAPTRGDVHNNYGTFLCRSGEYTKAIQQFQLAVANINYMDPAAAYENAGLCAIKIPDKKLAIQYFKKSIQQDPERSSVYLAMAELQYQTHDYKDSKQSLEEFLRLSNPNKESFRLSELLHMQLGKDFPIGEA